MGCLDFWIFTHSWSVGHLHRCSPQKYRLPFRIIVAFCHRRRRNTGLFQPHPKNFRMRLNFTSLPAVGCLVEFPSSCLIGPGIWCASETHLTSVTQRSSDAKFRQLAQSQNRAPKILYGARVAPRANSEWAGTWSGVLTLSDVPARSLSLPWPSEVWSTGRVQASRHFVDQIPFTIANVYGWLCG